MQLIDYPAKYFAHTVTRRDRPDVVAVHRMEVNGRLHVGAKTDLQALDCNEV